MTGQILKKEGEITHGLKHTGTQQAQGIFKVIMEKPNSRDHLVTRDWGKVFWQMRCTKNITAEKLTQAPSFKLEDV